jgi:hypothetical protein
MFIVGRFGSSDSGAQLSISAFWTIHRENVQKKFCLPRLGQSAGGGALPSALSIASAVLNLPLRTV